MADNTSLSPQQFAESVEPLVKFLKDKFEKKPLYISDIRDVWNRQCVDLVQEGGGVYGIALAGYTYILEKMNIAFIKMAGTSAGSINTLLLASVYTKTEAQQLGRNNFNDYYETRSEKVLEYLAKKDLSEIVDGHPLWRKIILGIFNNPNGPQKLWKKILLWAKYAAAALALFLFISGLSLYLTLRCFNGHLWRISSVATWIALALILILIIGFAAKGMLLRFLYRHAERLGINPGDDFQKWIHDILCENGADTVTSLKAKISSETAFNPTYQPPLAAELEKKITPVIPMPDPYNKTTYDSIDPILDMIENNSISLDFISDQINLLYKSEDPASPAALRAVIPRIVKAFEKRTMNAFAQGISGAGTITRELVMVTSDLTNQIKVEFPGMHRMYWGKDYEISPSNYVRASMSVPFFFKPFQVFYDRNQKQIILDEWSTYTKVYKDLGTYALFVDGGMLSNFPINVFNDPSIPLPRKPTLGIKLEYNDESTSDPINSLFVFGSRMVSTMRFFYDRDFLIKNESYRKTVRSVDTGKISWLNFGLSDQQKIELFFRGALSAALFLAGSDSDDTELAGLCNKGKSIPFSKTAAGHFNMYETDPRKFECAELDPLLGDVRFSWAGYKAERIESLLAHPIQKDNLKSQASSVT